MSAMGFNGQSIYGQNPSGACGPTIDDTINAKAAIHPRRAMDIFQHNGNHWNISIKGFFITIVNGLNHFFCGIGF